MTSRYGANVHVVPGNIGSSSILGGSAVNTDGATIITIPAGRVWRGSVTLAASHTEAVDFVTTITIQGTDAVPASGTIVIAVTGSVVGLSATATYSPGPGAANDIYVASPLSNAVTLVLNNPVASSAIATAHGILL